METFKGWYRKSLTKDKWHRVNHVNHVNHFDSIATTVCNRKIPAMKCDYKLRPFATTKCTICLNEKYAIETGKAFIPTKITPLTKSKAIIELRRLLKPRIYHIKIWDIYSIEITAKWASDTSIDIYTEIEIITKKRILTLEQVQTDLSHFKSEIEYLCNASDELAREAKLEKGVEGHLTEDEKIEYFEELMAIVEK